MKTDILTKLPSEIIINILWRLPIRTIISCKCVCKSLLILVESREFAASGSTPLLAVLDRDSWLYKIYEIKDVLDVMDHTYHYRLLTEFSLPCREVEFCPSFRGCIHGSADGLLLLVDTFVFNGLYVCNPITRDYIQLHCQEPPPRTYVATYGIGASKMTGQYKVVRIFGFIQSPRFECQVYTLGTRRWRRIDPGPSWGRIEPRIFNRRDSGVFVNGNLHWLVYDSHGSLVISGFDLETELFSALSLPVLSTLSLPIQEGKMPRLGLSNLCDCLCVCDNLCNDKFVIWLMKEYGAEKSWKVEYVIWKTPQFVDRLQDGLLMNILEDGRQAFRPIRVFRNGDILIAIRGHFLFFYSHEAEVGERLDFFTTSLIDSILHITSFIPLKSDDPFRHVL